MHTSLFLNVDGGIRERLDEDDLASVDSAQVLPPVGGLERDASTHDSLWHCPRRRRRRDRGRGGSRCLGFPFWFGFRRGDPISLQAAERFLAQCPAMPGLADIAPSSIEDL